MLPPQMQNRSPAWHFLVFRLCAWVAGVSVGTDWLILVLPLSMSNLAQRQTSQGWETSSSPQRILWCLLNTYSGRSFSLSISSFLIPDYPSVTLWRKPWGVYSSAVFQLSCFLSLQRQLPIICIWPCWCFHYHWSSCELNYCLVTLQFLVSASQWFVL